MADMRELRLKFLSIKSTLIEQAMVDSRYQELKDIDREDRIFAHQLLNEFFTSTEKALYEMRRIVYKKGDMDQNKLAIELHMIKGSSDSVGAVRVANACQEVRAAYTGNDRKRCLNAIKELKKEFNLVKPHLEALVEIEKEIWAAGGTIY